MALDALERWEKTKINIDTGKLKVLLHALFYEEFNQKWGDLPTESQEHWTQMATELAKRLLQEEVVKVTR